MFVLFLLIFFLFCFFFQILHFFLFFNFFLSRHGARDHILSHHFSHRCSLLTSANSYFLSPRHFQKLILCIVLATAFCFFNTRHKRRGGPWGSLGAEDVAVITGGSNGLGLNIARLLIQHGVQVIILDIEPIQREDVASSLLTTYYYCDLRDDSQVAAAIRDILKNHDPVTLLVNNAGIRHSERFTDLSVSKEDSIWAINTRSPLLLLRAFLPRESRGAKRLYVVTVSSILGLVSPARLSLYSASKAALISLHDSLSHENSDSQVRFLLVTPGQLNTRLFSDVRPPKQRIAPIVSSAALAAQIVARANAGERGTLHGPAYTYFIPLLRLLPYSLNEFARWFSEMDTSVHD